MGRFAIVVTLVACVIACGDDSASTEPTSTTTSTGGTASDGGGGAAASTGGAGGTPAGCSPYVEGSCEDGLVCVVSDDALGLEGGTACQAPGEGGIYSVCGSDADCAGGALCDRVMQTCKPVCDTDADCPEESPCAAAFTGAGAVIPGLKLCLAGCDPVSNEPCDNTVSPANCVYREDESAFDCAPAGRKTENFACETHLECTTDFGCLAINGDSGCFHWCVVDPGTDICTAQEHPDAQFALCVPQSPTIAVDGVEYGGCVKQL